MPMLGRGKAIPRDTLARATMLAGERPLASAQLTDGSWLVATLHALHRVAGAPDGAGPTEDDNARHGAGHREEGHATGGTAHADTAGAPTWRREWTTVDRASLKPEERLLIVRWTSGEGEERYELDTRASRLFTRVVNERITASIVTSREIKVPGGVARIAVRRKPDGELFSEVITIGAVDAADPDVARQIDEVEDGLRELCGLR